MRTQVLLIELTLAACERGDAEGSRDLLRGALPIERAESRESAAMPRALSFEQFADVALDCTPSHIRNIIARREIPPGALAGATTTRRAG